MPFMSEYKFLSEYAAFKIALKNKLCRSNLVFSKKYKNHRF